VRATTRLLDVAPDLNDVAGDDGYLFVRDGVGFAGRGVAVRGTWDDIPRLLSTIVHTDESGTNAPGPIALGTMPFSDAFAGTAVIPRLLVGKDGTGRCWCTTIDDEPMPVFSSPPPPMAASFQVSPLTPVDSYLAAVTAARDAVREGRLIKAVIARQVEVRASEPISVHSVLTRLRNSFGSSHRYSFDGFIGASPELLLSIEDDVVRSHPLAGTTPRTGDPATDDELARKLLASIKDQIEHRVVIDVIHDMLLPHCSYLDWEPEPSVVKVANVQHLGTLIEGRLRADHPPILDLVRALCPTPALGGHPRTEALELIDSVEGFARGNYGGAIGWVDAHGNGTWAVAIRCATLSPDRRSAVLTAGGGIVADSDPLAELAETQAKFQAMLSAIVRP
jgi:menaquinone-specific isochorismate synthase